MLVCTFMLSPSFVYRLFTYTLAALASSMFLMIYEFISKLLCTYMSSPAVARKWFVFVSVLIAKLAYTVLELASMFFPLARFKPHATFRFVYRPLIRVSRLFIQNR